jgi:hypothetical protein
MNGKLQGRKNLVQILLLTIGNLILPLQALFSLTQNFDTGMKYYYGNQPKKQIRTFFCFLLGAF